MNGTLIGTQGALRKLQLGCLDQPLPGWINTDITPHIFISRVPGLPPVLCALGLITEQRRQQHKTGIFRRVRYLDVRRIFPFTADSFDYVYCSHMLEHLYPQHAEFCLGEVHRVLKRGAVARIAVPDLDEVIGGYDPLNPDDFLESFFEASEPRAKNRHHWHYNEVSLCGLLERAGFSKITRCKAGACREVSLVETRLASLVMEAVK
jgi:SAM-dependent methyltransferase